MKDPKDITINGKQLSDILESHKLWLFGTIAKRADLSYANLSSANLSYANLSYANLSYADLSYANLSSANLSYANLSYANLRSANLSYANLSYANLSSAKNAEMADAITRIIPDGAIIGWKKCNQGIIKLLIPAKAKRSNATGRKCRAEYAVDKGHFTFGGKKTNDAFTSMYDNSFVYRVGETITPNRFDDNRWDECSNGVHFFITRWEAENYDG